jgi:hypothetical protein
MKDLAIVLATLFFIIVFGSIWKARQPVVPERLDAYQKARLRYEAAHSGRKHRRKHRSADAETRAAEEPRNSSGEGSR